MVSWFGSQIYTIFLPYTYHFSYLLLFIRWELCPEQRTYFEYTQHLNAYLREEYHSLNVRIYHSRILIRVSSSNHSFFFELESHFQRYDVQRWT